MRSDQFFKFLGMIDEDMLLASDEKPKSTRTPHKAVWASAAVVAACVLITLSIMLTRPLFPTEYDIEYETFDSFALYEGELEYSDIWIYYPNDNTIDRKLAKMPLSIKNIFETWKYLCGIDGDVELIGIIPYDAESEQGSYTVEISGGDVRVKLVISEQIKKYTSEQGWTELVLSLRKTVRGYLKSDAITSPSTGPGDGGNVTTPPPPADTEPEAPEVELPNFGGATFHVLSAGMAPYNDFNHSENCPTKLGKMSYERQRVAEQSLGIKFRVITKTETNPETFGVGYQSFKTSYLSGMVDYNMGLIGASDSVRIAYSGYAENINTMQAINTSGSWWDQGSVRDLSVDGKLYMINGWASAEQTRSASVLYINRMLAKETELEDPYELVQSGRWTIDKLEEFAKVSNATFYPTVSGIYGSNESIFSAMAGCGAVTVSRGNNGMLELRMGDELSKKAFLQYTSLMYSSYATRYEVEGKDPISALGEGAALIMTGYLSDADEVSKMSGEYAILPYPKLYEGADTPYYTMLGRNTVQYVCFMNSFDDDKLFSGVVAEVLAISGEKLLKPAAYTDILTGSIDSSDNARKMLDVIFSSTIHDMGLHSRIASYDRILLELYKGKGTEYSSTIETIRQSAESSVSALNNMFESLS